MVSVTGLDGILVPIKACLRRLLPPARGKYRRLTLKEASMHTRMAAFAAAILSLCCNSLTAQTTAFGSMLYPRTISSAGIGEQGVASGDAGDALQYNPAHLVSATGISLSFFRNPFYWMGMGSFPLTSMTVVSRLGNGGSVGVEYTDWDFGETNVRTQENPESTDMFHLYERSAAIAYAMPLATTVSFGGEVRYVWQPVPESNNASQLLFSAGVVYRPAVYSDRLTLGFSLMNLGGAVDYEYTTTLNGQKTTGHSYDAPPSQLHLGANILAVQNNLFDLKFAIGASKVFDKRASYPSYEGQSSFKGLLNDWDDFPNDMTAQFGLGYTWHPISLGAGVSFIQNMYLGYNTTGPKGNSYNFYTHAFNIGLKAKGLTFTAGYAGRWHINYNFDYWPWMFPWETFQFSLNADPFLLVSQSTADPSAHVPHNIILAGGYAYGLAVGRMKEESSGPYAVRISSPAHWQIESDFYVDERSAVVSELSYARMKEELRYLGIATGLEAEMESFSFASGYRYHPVETFSPLFVQISLGIIRLNPINNSQPKYAYQAFDKVSAGLLIPLTGSGLIIMPKVALMTFFFDALDARNKLSGYNQFEFGVNAGYTL